MRLREFLFSHLAITLPAALERFECSGYSQGEDWPLLLDMLRPCTALRSCEIDHVRDNMHSDIKTAQDLQRYGLPPLPHLSRLLLWLPFGPPRKITDAALRSLPALTMLQLLDFQAPATYSDVENTVGALRALTFLRLKLVYDDEDDMSEPEGAQDFLRSAVAIASLPHLRHLHIDATDGALV